jgi:hypothetical protein
LFEKKKMPRRMHLNRKGKNKRAEVGVKSEKAKQKLEGKLPPFFVFLFFFYGFLFFSST